MRLIRRGAALLCALLLCVANALNPEESVSQNAQDSDGAEPPSPQALSVVQANVWSGLNYAGIVTAGELEPDAAREFRYSLFEEQLGALEPDLVGINGANPLPAYAEQLAGALEMSQISHWRMAGVRIGVVGLPVNLREGDAILASPELELQFSGRLGLSGGPAGTVTAFQLSEANQLLGGTVTAAGRTVHVFVTRFHASPFASAGALAEEVGRYAAEEVPPDDFLQRVQRAVRGKSRRSSELERALVFINEVAGKAPVILMGSMNILPDGDAAARLRDAGFVDAYAPAGSGPGYTWNPDRNRTLAKYEAGPWEEPHRLDYIWVRGEGLQVRNAALVLEEATYGVHPSTRFGVWAEIVVSP